MAPALLPRALIRVSGPEARLFLQGMLTQSVDKLTDAAPLYAALLTPQGKLAADMHLWAGARGAVIIEADPARAADLAARLRIYKLRAQVEIEDAGESLCVLFSATPFEGAAPDPRFPDGALGWRAIAPRPQDAPEGASAYERLRLERGVPDLARDGAPGEVFALEALLEELHGVDFRKGCFVGQENVSRMKRRATTRRKFCPVNFDGPPPAFGAPIRAGPAELGQIRSGGEGRAIALIRLDRAFEALEKGETLEAEGRAIALAPPPWLILPSRETGPDDAPKH